MSRRALWTWLPGLAAIIACGWLLAGQESDFPHVRNLHRVDEHIYRGGRPGPGGIRELAKMGVRTVIDLQGTGSAIKSEMQEASAAGLRFVSIPMKTTGRPNEETVREVLRLMESPDTRPVFVHCRQGSHRTGVVIACYRIRNDHWTVEQALAEAEKYGLGTGHAGFREFIRNSCEDPPQEPG